MKNISYARGLLLEPHSLLAQHSSLPGYFIRSGINDFFAFPYDSRLNPAIKKYGSLVVI